MPEMVNIPVTLTTSQANPRNSVNASVANLWEGMEGDIIVVHSAWNVNRASHNIDIEQYDPLLGHSLKDKDVTEEQVEEIITRLTRYGSLLVEGDTIAVDHILSILRHFYDPEVITLKNSWELGANCDEIKRNSYFKKIQNSNVILTCGPLGNLITSIFMQKANISWLLASDESYKMYTHPDPEKTEVFSLEYDDLNRLQYDTGVFLRSRNPYNPYKQMYLAMGIHAHGTQGAAALACNNDSAQELINLPLDPEFEKRGIDYIAWVKVWNEVTSRRRKNEKGFLESFTDPGLRYQIIHPSVNTMKLAVHRNPSLIKSTLSSLRSEILSGVSVAQLLFLERETILDMGLTLLGLAGGVLLIF